MQRIAFFGGSFDPPHRGHLAIAEAAADQFALDQVLFAPVAAQPLKGNTPAAPFLHRYAMTALATQTDARFIPSLLDAPGDGPGSRPNYTVETLERLRGSLGREARLFTLLGADSWTGIARWHQAPRLLASCDWIVASRPGFPLASAESALPEQIAVEQLQEQAQDSANPYLLMHHPDGRTTRVYFLLSIEEDISATQLRRSLAAEHASADSVPATVLSYIEKTGLYRTP